MPRISPEVQQTFDTCEHGGDDCQCLCPNRQRTGPLVRLFGKHTPCMLIGVFAQAAPACPDYKRLAGEKHKSLFDLVEQARAEDQEDGE